MLTFVVGAAFAFAPGIIDINGRVNLAAQDDLYVVWTDVIGGPDFQLITSTPVATPFGWEYGASHTGQIVDARARTAQRIVWNINFSELSESGEAFASITATAANNSIRPAIITGGSITWTNESGFTAADFGLTVDFDTTGFTGEVLEQGDSTEVTVYVSWDGTIPEGFTFDGGIGYTHAASFIIDFDYAPYAPE